MLLPRKWALSLGLLAAVPSVSMAGPFDFLKPNSAEQETAEQVPEKDNQQVAEEIAKALSKARLEHKNVQIEYKAGVAKISGQIANQQQRALVTRLVSRVDGVTSVENKLELIAATPAGPQSIQQASAASPAGAREPVAQAMHRGDANRAVDQVSLEKPAPSNQIVAQKIADSLVTAGLSGYDIEVRYKNGIASLIGSVEDKEQVMRAHRAASSVAGVNEVLNRLTVKGKPVDIQQAAGYPQQQRLPVPASAARGQFPVPPQQGMNPAAMQQGMNPAAMQQVAMQRAAMQQAAMQQAAMQQQSPGMAPGPAMGPPQYGHAQPASHQIYNQPQVPSHAWPSYAAYDNYAAVTYPSMYDASAWPYIGPYYPYPQVPLGWRSSTLEWDDGQWNLKFSSRTDRWWWFLNPHNWHDD